VRNSEVFSRVLLLYSVPLKSKNNQKLQNYVKCDKMSATI